MNVEVLSLAIEKRYFKNFEKFTLHDGLYAVIYWCEGGGYMTPMTELLVTALKTLETCNRGFNLISYNHDEIVFREDNPLRCNVDRQLRITKDKVNEGGYILALNTDVEECVVKRVFSPMPQAELWFTNETELEIALKVFYSYPLVDTPERPYYKEGTSPYNVLVTNLYKRISQLYSGVREGIDHGVTFIDKDAYLDGELVVRHYEDCGVCLTTGGCTLYLNPWEYSNSALDSWLVMFKTFIDRIKEVHK